MNLKSSNFKMGRRAVMNNICAKFAAPGSSSKLTVAVFMGGPSSEHSISVASAREILKHINRAKYGIREVFVSKNGVWFVNGSATSPREALRGADCALIAAMHGEYGEDGTLQRLLDRHGVPYTGSGARSSTLGMNKWKSRQAFKALGLAVPRSLLLRKKDFFGNSRKICEKVAERCGRGPWVVKPNGRGSSVGVSLVMEKSKISHALRRAFRFDELAIVEEYISGKEVAVPILEMAKGPGFSLPLVEIRPRKSRFFDYREKYAEGGAREIVPAPLRPKQKHIVLRSALAAHKALACKSYSRVDCILAGDQPFILEVNTLPGFTKTSLFPKSARAAGISFTRLLDILIKNALKHS